MSDDELIAKLTEAATAAIANERPSLEHDSPRVHRLSLDLEDLPC